MHTINMQVARRSWGDLVDYCCTTGGDPQHTESGIRQTATLKQ